MMVKKFLLLSTMFLFALFSPKVKAEDNKTIIVHDTTTTTEGVIGRTKSLDVTYVKGYTEICSIIGDKDLQCIRLPAAKKTQKK